MGLSIKNEETCRLADTPLGSSKRFLAWVISNPN